MSPEDIRLKQWLRNGTPIGTSAICWAEFLCGPLNQHQLTVLERIVGEPVPFTRADAQRAADLFNATRRRRGTFVDCMIAAAALEAGASIATTNTNDFLRFLSSGLHIERA